MSICDWNVYAIFLTLLEPIWLLFQCIDPKEMMQKETALFPSVMSHTDKRRSG